MDDKGTSITAVTTLRYNLNATTSQPMLFRSSRMWSSNISISSNRTIEVQWINSRVYMYNVPMQLRGYTLRIPAHNAGVVGPSIHRWRNFQSMPQQNADLNPIQNQNHRTWHIKSNTPTYHLNCQNSLSEDNLDAHIYPW